MNTCEKYIREKGGFRNIAFLSKGHFGYFIRNRKENKKVYIDESLYEDRKRISKKFKEIISALLK